MPDSVLLISWDSFLVTQPLISSKTCIIHPSVTPETNVSCDCLFLAPYYAFLETAANFRLLLSVAISLEEGKVQ